MNKIIKALSDWGCETTDTMERMGDDEDFYIECLKEIPGDVCFQQLKQEIENHNTKKAFDVAHTLKGMLANMGLTPMYVKVSEIVEPLRGGNSENLMGKFDELMEMRTQLSNILQE